MMLTKPSGAPSAASIHLLHLMAEEAVRRQAIIANTRMILVPLVLYIGVMGYDFGFQRLNE